MNDLESLVLDLGGRLRERAWKLVQNLRTERDGLHLLVGPVVAVQLESMAGFLGDKALEPEVYYESDWGSEEWTRGAYASSYDLGGLHRYGKDQHAPVGPIMAPHGPGGSPQ